MVVDDIVEVAAGLAIGTKEMKKEKEEKERNWGDIILSFCSFGMMVLLFGLFFLGALSHYGGMSLSEYEEAVNSSMLIVASAGTTVLTNFYEVGMKKPSVWIFLFAMIIVYWIGYLLIWEHIKYFKSRGKKKNA